MMHVCHFTNFAPRQSGMYESTKDQIKYERRCGLQSDLVDPHDKHKDGRDVVDDGWLSPVPWSVAEKADVWVLHSFIPEKIKHLFKDKVTVAILHGPTEHMLLKEWSTGLKEQAINLHINIMWKYDATVCINQHEYDIHKIYDEYDKLHYIPNSIDLERYTNDGMVWEYQAHPAICSFDVPRLEKLPAHAIWMMPKVVEKIPTARMNLFSLTLEPIAMWRNLFVRSHAREMQTLCETIQLENNNLAPFMRGADMVLNNNISGIASRVSMESMAMGVPVISYGGDYTPYVARIWDLDSLAEQVQKCWTDLVLDKAGVKRKTKAYAVKNFDRGKEVKKYVALYKELMEKKHG